MCNAQPITWVGTAIGPHISVQENMNNSKDTVMAKNTITAIKAVNVYQGVQFDCH